MNETMKHCDKSIQEKDSPFSCPRRRVKRCTYYPQNKCKKCNHCKGKENG